MATHTKGPWKTSLRNATELGAVQVARVYLPAKPGADSSSWTATPVYAMGEAEPTREIAEANAVLIAESPAMYELLERIAKAEAYSPTEEVWQEEARSIIQRINAKGE